MKTFNKITISFTLLICLLFSYSLLYQVYLEQTDPIYDNTLRFHVRADSDKKEAQKRKLIVRDAVLRYVKEDVYKADSAQELKQNLAEKTEEKARILKSGLFYYGYFFPFSSQSPRICLR